MIETAEVFLWGTRIGVLHQKNGDNTASFEYDRSFQRSRIELSPFKMPLSDRIYAFPELNRSDAFRGVYGLTAGPFRQRRD